MTEAEWLACESPTVMLDFVKSWSSLRKLRLFVAGSGRLVWPMLGGYERGYQPQIEELERHAEGLADPDGTKQRAADAPLDDPDGNVIGRLDHIYSANIDYLIDYATGVIVNFLGPRTPGYNEATYEVRMAMFKSAEAEQKRRLPGLLREVIGNPFRPVNFSAAWRTDTALRLARQMYDSRDFSAMPILADALQDAGYDNDDVLSHCRGDGPHVRGCWVVDLVLGKKE